MRNDGEGGQRKRKRQAESWTVRGKSRTDWVGMGGRWGGMGKPDHLCFQSGKQSYITYSSLCWDPYWAKWCNILLGVWPFSHFALCSSLNLKWKSLDNEAHSLRLSLSNMGEPECVLQNELKALGGGFICIYGVEGFGVGGQRMFMCSSVNISPEGFLCALIGAIVASQNTVLRWDLG